ncbi:MAG: hypothetical protein ACSHX9_09790 [Luteolibacter sp.]
MKPDLISNPDGSLSDTALYEEMLESSSGNRLSDLAAVRQALATGMPLATALRLFVPEEDWEAVKSTVEG